MITAKNYAAQAEQDLIIASHTIRKDYPRTIFMYKAITKLIADAVHFVIPDDGNLLNDGYKGMTGNVARLPFNAITIEYFVSNPTAIKSGQIHIAKRLIVAVDASVMNGILGTKTEGIFVYSVQYFKGKWILQSAGAVIPYAWESVADTGMQAVKACPEIFDHLAESGEWDIFTDISSDCGAVMELLEALSCRNVSVSNFQDAPPANKKRIKAGKLPFYETKMLVIDTHSGTSSKTGNGGGSHASPRQHPRRGHIRRLESGNIWVNSCVVGDPTKGSINKQYSVV